MSLATNVTDLTAKRDSVIADYIALDPLGPDISVDGVSISQMEHGQNLLKTAGDLTTLIERLSGPCVVFTQGR